VTEPVRRVAIEVVGLLVELADEGHGEVELTSRAEDAEQLLEDSGRFRDVLEDLGAECGVERAVLDRQRLERADEVRCGCAAVRGVLPVGGDVLAVGEQLPVRSIARTGVEHARAGRQGRRGF
jgi:hypothetical protein